MNRKHFREVSLVVLAVWFCFPQAKTEEWFRYNNSEFYVEYTVAPSYFDAELGCRSLNARLAFVKSQQTQEFLLEKIRDPTSKPFSFFIGLVRSANGFTWTDGTPLSQTYSNWALLKGRSQQPNNRRPGQQCATMGWYEERVPGYQWNDEYCDGQKQPARYICERPAVEDLRKLNDSTHHCSNQNQISVIIMATFIGLIFGILFLLFGHYAIKRYIRKKKPSPVVLNRSKNMACKNDMPNVDPKDRQATNDYLVPMTPHDSYVFMATDKHGKGVQRHSDNRRSLETIAEDDNGYIDLS